MTQKQVIYSTYEKIGEILNTVPFVSSNMNGSWFQSVNNKVSAILENKFEETYDIEWIQSLTKMYFQFYPKSETAESNNLTGNTSTKFKGAYRDALNDYLDYKLAA